MSTFLFLFFVGALWIAPIFMARWMGKKFNFHNAWLWGFFLGWIGVFILSTRMGFRLTSRQGMEKTFGKETTAMVDRVVEPYTGARKTCPDCAESVQEAANVCKHCGHRFETPTLSAPTST
jgi:hypothetical protein